MGNAAPRVSSTTKKMQMRRRHVMRNKNYEAHTDNNPRLKQDERRKFRAISWQ